ncbi:MAG: tetratricopeptide repeat protein [Candidatus Riflebacteria bacterium]|nr:tetratricopeptide repeat protein [Candidatus Riflebacteria bacterium]
MGPFRPDASPILIARGAEFAATPAGTGSRTTVPAAPPPPATPTATGGHRPALAAPKPPLAAKGGPVSLYFQAVEALRSGAAFQGLKKYYKFLLLSDPLLAAPLREHDLRGAAGHFPEPLPGTAPSKEAALALVLLDRLLERWEGGLRRLDALRAAFPTSAVLTFLKGELLLAAGRDDEARRLFAELATLPDPRRLPALARFLLGRHGAGEPPSPTARREFLLKAAARRWDLLDLEGAIAAYQAVIGQFPDHPEAPRALIDLLTQMDRPADAAQVLQEWEDRTGRPLLDPLPLARLRYAQGRFAEAVQVLRPLAAQDPPNALARLLLAECLFQTGGYDEAASWFQKLAAADPGNLGLLQRLAVCLEALGRPGEAATRLGMALERSPDEAPLRQDLAFLLMRMGDLDQAAIQFAFLADSDSPARYEAKKQLAVISRLKLERDGAGETAESAAGPTDPAESSAAPDHLYWEEENTHLASPGSPEHQARALTQDQIDRINQLVEAGRP